MRNKRLNKLIASFTIMVFMFSFTGMAFAADLNDIPNNVMRLGNDVYDFTSPQFDAEQNLVDSLTNGGNQGFVKLGGNWYDIFALTDDQINDPAYGTDTSSWTGLGTFFQADGTEATIEDGISEVTVTAINATADVNVAYGTALADAGLPATVGVTLSDEATADYAVEWAEGDYDGNTAATYALVGTITVPEGVAATELTAAVNVVVAEEVVDLAVSSVSATNATTVEVVFNQAPAEGATLTYTVAGTAYTPVMDGATATLTVATLVDDAATAVVVNDGAADLYNSTVTYDKNEITTLSLETVDFNKTIGNDFTLTVKLVDEDGDAMANEEIKLEASGVYDAFEDAITLTSTTDASGLATFTWARTHDTVVGDTFDVYAVNKPVVRNNGSVIWTLADQLVTVDKMAADTLGDNTTKEYIVTAKTSSGSNYDDNLIIELSGDADIDAQAAGGQNVKFEMWDTATSAWVDVADGRVTETAATTITVDMTAELGTLKFRLYNYNDGVANTMTNVDTITPTIYEDADGGTDMDNTEARVVASTISYVAQTPSITFTKTTDNTMIAEVAVAGSAIDYVLYNLVVVDQFGNPFRGTVELDQYADIDNNVTTAPAAQAFEFFVDLNNDGDFADAGEATAAQKTLNFSFGGDDTGNDSTVVVKLANTNNNDTTDDTIEPTAYVDMANPASSPVDVANVLDSNDVYVKGAIITAQMSEVATLTLTPVDATAPAAGGFYVWSLTAKDQYDVDIATARESLIQDLNVQLLDKDGVVLTAAQAADLYVDPNGDGYNTTTGVSTKGNFTDTTGLGGGTAIELVAQDITVFPAYIGVDAGVGATEYQVRVFAEDLAAAGDNGTYETGEPVTTALVTYANQVLTAGSISAVTTAGSAVEVINADKTAGYSDHVTNDGAVTFQYDLLDQSNQAMTTTSNTDVSWTITNNGASSITVNDGAAKTLAAGATATYTTTAAAGAGANATIIITSQAEAKVDVSVAAAGVATPDTFELYYTETVLGADSEYCGTVVAFDDTANWLIVDTAIGYVVVDNYAAAGTFTAATYKVAGNTATIAQFETNLTVGDSITATTDGTPDIAIVLTNN